MLLLRSATPAFSRTTRGLLALWAWGILGLASAQTTLPAQQAKPAELSVGDWLVRMHQASRQRSYVGTFVISSSSGAMSSGRIWHACDGPLQVERVESLTGAPRSTFRRNDEVVIFVPESRVVRTEKRELLGMFPDLLKSSETTVPDFYSARRLGTDRVAGFEAEVVQLTPKDNLRFGYRIWSERKSGLVMKVQTLDGDSRVLEQAAFSELQLDAPVRADKLARMMAPPEGWRVERDETVRTTAAQEGWALKAAVPGFKPMSCFKRPAEGVMQWVFSDGLGAVSLFVEAYDAQRHAQEGIFASGATNTLTRRMQDWWLTAVGEVPPQTLRAFAQSLERRK
ncbi:MucB/RseB C-terminal domain-containing protein [Ramlibacter sp.]|uniref:MucB/RseB C-terminal domain-containing protein n=1 Tax=Ramlibacter sp. TaxID=1917967 RepID=UPI0017A7625B|nr:MucB/RseB C-terminal domain-containing protein [Ramlibacter sp.]MBA2674242.1 MucB/RseB C-terminal domain-containing protein [Ramlibacter sp.]